MERLFVQWYEELFRDDKIINALGNSLIIAVLASIFATVLGTAAAIGISNFKGKKDCLYKVRLTFRLSALTL